MIRKWHSQKEITSLKREVGKNKFKTRYLNKEKPSEQPVILYYLSFQGDNSVVVLIVLCLGV